MIPNALQIAKEKQAEIRREAAEMNRLSRITDQRKPSWIKGTITIAISLAIGITLFLEFIG